MGFDFYAQCWAMNVSYGAPVFRLMGHAKPLVSVAPLANRPQAVTADEGGVFKVSLNSAVHPAVFLDCSFLKRLSSPLFTVTSPPFPPHLLPRACTLSAVGPSSNVVHHGE